MGEAKRRKEAAAKGIVETPEQQDARKLKNNWRKAMSVYSKKAHRIIRGRIV